MPKKQSKIKTKFPVISPKKGIMQINTLAQAIRPAELVPLDQEHTYTTSLTQLHTNVPSDLGIEQWDVLHHRLTQSYSDEEVSEVPESPLALEDAVDDAPHAGRTCNTVSPSPSPPTVPITRKTSHSHVFDTDGDDSFPCIHLR